MGKRFAFSRGYLLGVALFIGDSHSVGSFGLRLDELLRTMPSMQVASYGSCGTSPYAWFSGATTQCGYRERTIDGVETRLKEAATPLLFELLEKHKPVLTIVALGANLFKAPITHAARTVRQMAEQVAASGSRCVWVGPPDSRERMGPKMDYLYEILFEASSPYCHFIDSRWMTRYPEVGGDGTHYDHLGLAGAEITHKWASEVFRGVKSVYVDRESGPQCESGLEDESMSLPLPAEVGEKAAVRSLSVLLSS